MPSLPRRPWSARLGCLHCRKRLRAVDWACGCLSDALLVGNWHTMNFFDQRMDGSEFKNCSLANAVFDDVNLSGSKLTNVNLSGLTIENANIKGLKIFGYDVENWIREQLRKDGCHLD